MEKIEVEEKEERLFYFRGDARELISVRSEENGFFSELDWVQLFSPNIDLLGSSSNRSAEPPE